jgi:hypothetical protein
MNREFLNRTRWVMRVDNMGQLIPCSQTEGLGSLPHCRWMGSLAGILD